MTDAQVEGITDAQVEAVEQTFARWGRHNCATRPMIRAALAAAQAGATDRQGELRWLDEFAHTILREFEGVLPDPERCELTPLEKGRQAFIADARAKIRNRVDRALRPPAAAADETCSVCGWQRVRYGSAPLLASEPAGPSEEDVALAIRNSGAVIPIYAMDAYRKMAQAVMALLRRGKE